MRKYTQSELKTYRECKRKWWLGQYRGLRIKPEYEQPGAAHLGSLVHGCLEVHDLGHDWREVLEYSRECSQELLADHSARLKDSMDNHSFAAVMVSGYIEWLEETGADQFLETIAVEQRVEVPWGDDSILMGKLDKRVRNTVTGDEWFVDYKTVPNLTDIPRRAAIDEQFLFYTTILKEQLGEAHVRGGIWRMLVKSKRTDRTLKDDGSGREFFGEHEYQFNDHQLAAFRVRIDSLIEEIEMTEIALNAGANHHRAAYPTPTPDCSWKCEFVAICPMFDDGSRVEQYISDWYEERDPLERYEDLNTETTNKGE